VRPGRADAPGLGGAPSRTGEVVATMRSELVRPTSPGGDPDAQRRLCAGMRPGRAPALERHVAARTRFFDDHVLEAVAAGVGQIVILGAGYDDRALRFPAPGVRYFEVDHPDTQADKHRRLAELGWLDALTPVAVDFRCHGVADALARAGHDAARPTLFLCEGLLIYLDDATTVSLLSALRERAGPSGLLAASLAVHADGLTSSVVVARANAGRRHGGAEPWRTIVPASVQRDLLTRAGWRMTDVGAVDAGTGWGRTLLVTAEPA
jgi:methyltransferase (TIGR00027 family)